MEKPRELAEGMMPAVLGVAPQDVWAATLEWRPIVCVDAFLVGIDDNKKVYLPKRRIRPACGKRWPVGGSVRKNERFEDAMKRHLKADIAYDDPAVHLEFLGVRRYFFPDSEQGTSTDSVCMLYAVHLTAQELARANSNLDPTEYFHSDGLKGYTWSSKYGDDPDSSPLIGDVVAGLLGR